MALSERVLRAVNEEPPLQSMLYDCNMLPEQIDNSDDEASLTLAVACYMLGKGCWETWVKSKEDLSDDQSA